MSRQWRPTEQAKFEISVAETNGHGLVDVTKPDLKAHPEYENAKGLRCKVKEGDALFVPANWHHASTRRQPQHWHQLLVSGDGEQVWRALELRLGSAKKYE